MWTHVDINVNMSTKGNLHVACVCGSVWPECGVCVACEVCVACVWPVCGLCVACVWPVWGLCAGGVVVRSLWSVCGVCGCVWVSTFWGVVVSSSPRKRFALSFFRRLPVWVSIF
jgi:hypothetical protein